MNLTKSELKAGAIKAIGFRSTDNLSDALDAIAEKEDISRNSLIKNICINFIIDYNPDS